MKRLLGCSTIAILSHLAVFAQEPGGIIASVAAAALADQRVQKRTYVFTETGKRVAYGLFVPSNYDPAKKWPVIVGLHGAGNPYYALLGYDGAVDLAQRDGYILVTPLGYNAFGWYGSAGSGFAGKQDAQGVRQALDDVERAFKLGVGAFEAGDVPVPPPANLGELSEKDVMNVVGIVRKEFNVDPDRVYLWGHSMGGFGAYYLAAKYPDIWAAVAVAAPSPDASLALLQQFQQIPVLVLQGDADETVVRTRATIAKMKQLGMEYVYVEVPGGDHAGFIARNKDTLSKVFAFFNIAQKSQRGH